MKILRKALPAALALCLLFLSPVWAQDTRSTELNADIPGEHTLTVSAPAGGGHAEYNGKTISGSTALPRQQDAVITAVPDAGWVLGSAEYNGTPITPDDKGRITLPNVTRDGALTLNFKQGKPAPTVKPTPTPAPTPVPPTGLLQGSGIGAVLLILLLCLVGVVVLVRRRRR